MKFSGYPSIDKLKEIFEYDGDTGMFKRLDGSPRALKGWTKGTLTKLNYRTFSIYGKTRLAHILAYALHHGSYPSGMIDHINGDPSDNRIDNLRIATHQQNMCNRKVRCDNTSGFPGVNFHKSSNKWQASIRVNGQRIHLGSFKTPVEAHEKYIEAVKIHHGEYSRK